MQHALSEAILGYVRMHWLQLSCKKYCQQQQHQDSAFSCQKNESGSES